MADLYDSDVAAWAEQQASALRRRAANEIDWNNVAEEIEGVAASQKREVRSRLRVICEHRLKWRHHPRRRAQGWRSTLDEQRRQLEELFEDSPSLCGFAERALPAAFVNGRQDAERKRARPAAGCRRRIFPGSCDVVH
jgi:hypothetical protein